MYIGRLILRCQSLVLIGCHAQIGLEMLVTHPGNDPSKWGIIQIFYNGQLFQNTTELNTAFADTTSGLNRQQARALHAHILTQHCAACQICGHLGPSHHSSSTFFCIGE